MYIVCDSKVVSPGCNDATLVGLTFDWTMGSVSASSTSFSFRNHFSEASLCICAFGYFVLVRGFDASALYLAGAEKCTS